MRLTNRSETQMATIQIVDDKPKNLTLLSSVLMKEGYEVRTSINGNLALASARKHPPDLILLDILMPEMNGYEVCQQLKADERTREIPVIFLSALAETPDRVEAFSTGGVDYITKPFQVEEVLARIETHLTIRKLQKELQEKNSQLEEKNEQLQESEARFKGLAGASFEAIIIHDQGQGQILDVNPTVTDLLGYNAEELIGSNLTQFLTEESQQRMAQHIQSGSLEPYEIEGIAKDGHIIPIEVRSKEIPYQGRPVRVAAGRDISQRKQVEAQQQRIAAMEERERIGRDLHDGLGQVMGYITVQSQNVSEFLRQGKIDLAQNTLTQLTRSAHTAHDDLRHYILDIRTAMETPPINFFEAMTQYVDKLGSQYNFLVQLSWPQNFSDSPLPLESETQLLRIIQEALTNARKHAGVNQAQVMITLASEEVQVIIIDNGQGFETELRAKNADTSNVESAPDPTPHFGLDIMRERAESVGGRLDVRSKPGEGTQVIVHLPQNVNFAPQKAVADLRILLVDDHALYLEGLRTMLTARGLQVVGMAADGLEAQSLAGQLQPDLILMDIEMPVCDGLEATRRIKTEFPDIKIVMLTAAADDETLFQALQAGANGYLLKNLKDDQFFKLLNQVMDKEIVLSPGLANRILVEFAKKGESPLMSDQEDSPVLTSRQEEVLNLVAQGFSNKEIARNLHISYPTVKFHVSQILERLQLRSRHELAHYAQKQGLLDTDN